MNHGSQCNWKIQLPLEGTHQQHPYGIMIKAKYPTPLRHPYFSTWVPPYSTHLLQIHTRSHQQPSPSSSWCHKFLQIPNDELCLSRLEMRIEKGSELTDIIRDKQTSCCHELLCILTSVRCTGPSVHFVPIPSLHMDNKKFCTAQHVDLKSSRCWIFPSGPELGGARA